MISSVLPVASNEREFEVPGFVGECIACGEIYGTCTKCENEVLIPEDEVSASVREQIPFMQRKGILLLPLVLIALLIAFAIAGAF